jgi:predicted dehydrogenase
MEKAAALLQDLLPMVENGKPLRAALIGVGGHGAMHLRALQTLENVEICGLCDVRQDAIEEALKSTAGHPTVSTHPAEFVESVDCDYAVVAVPNPARIPLIEGLLRRKIPLLIEKPAAHTLEDLSKLLQWQREAGVPVMVAHNYRFMPGALTVRNLLHQGTIGAVTDIHGFFKRNHAIAGQYYYGRLEGPLPFRIEMVIHHLDLVRGWIGGNARSIIADGRRTAVSWGVGETSCDVLAEFDNGVRLNYHGDWAAPANLTDFNGHWTLTGEKGCIQWRDNTVEVRLLHPDRVTWSEGERWIVTPAAGSEDSTLAEHKEWASSLREGRISECHLSDAAESLRLCLIAASKHSLSA